MQPLAPSTRDGFFDDFGGFAPEGSTQEGLDDGYIYTDATPGADGQAPQDWRQHAGNQSRQPSAAEQRPLSVSEAYRRQEAQWNTRRGPYGAASLRRAINSGYTADGAVRLPPTARVASAGSGRGGAKRLAGLASGDGIHKEFFHRLPEMPALPTRLTHEAILAEPTPTRVAEGLYYEQYGGFDEEYDGARTRNAEELAALQVSNPRPIIHSLFISLSLSLSHSVSLSLSLFLSLAPSSSSSPSPSSSRVCWSDDASHHHIAPPLSCAARCPVRCPVPAGAAAAHGAQGAAAAAGRERRAGPGRARRVRAHHQGLHERPRDPPAGACGRTRRQAW